MFSLNICRLLILVLFFVCVSAQWTKLGQDIDGENAGDFLSADDALAINGDGTVVAVGSKLNSDTGILRGHVRIFKLSPDRTTWLQRGSDIDGEAVQDLSGTSVALSSAGDTVVIGAPHNDGNGDKSGSVRVYDWDGSTWAQRGGDIDGEALGDNSGFRVDISGDSHTIVVGAPFNNDGGIYAGKG